MLTRLMVGALLALVLVPAGAAAAPHRLSKREARAEGLRFVAPFVDMLDLDRTVATRMVPPRRCRRVSAQTVTCRFASSRLVDGRVVRSWVRVHRQRDGLLGFRTPLDVLGEAVR
jgi:hypothetical protein